MKHIYALKSDSPDYRDFQYCNHDNFLCRSLVLPKSKSLITDECWPSVYDQGQIGSCAAHGACEAFVFAAKKDGCIYNPSMLGIYYDGRESEGNQNADSGMSIRGAFKTMAKIGVGPESMWPYDESKVFKKPPSQYYLAAEKMQAIGYYRIGSKLECVQAISSGFPVVCGFTLFSSFESKDVALTGRVQMPNAEKETILGGHCMLIGGYSLDNDYDGLDSHLTGSIIVQNSWGASWGLRGRCVMPMDYLFACAPGKNGELIPLSLDAWVLTKTETGR